MRSVASGGPGLDDLLSDFDGTLETVQPVLMVLGSTLSADSATLLLEACPEHEVSWFRRDVDSPGREYVAARARSTFDYLVGADADWRPPDSLAQPDGPAKYVGLPLAWGGRILGVLQVVGEELGERELTFLNSVVRQLAIVLERQGREREVVRKHARLIAHFENAPAGFVLLSGTGEILELNPFGAALLELELRETPGRERRSLPAILSREDRLRLTSHLAACLSSTDGRVHRLHVTTMTRGARRLQLSSRLGVGPRDEPVCSTVMVEVSSGEEHELRLLASAASLLGSLDPAVAMAATCRLFVPALADLCVLDLIERGPVLKRRAALCLADPTRTAAFVAAEERWGPLPNVGFASLEALRRLKPMVIPDVTPYYLDAAAVDQEHLVALIGLALKSWLVAPLLHPQEGCAIGLIRLATAGIRRPLRDHDCATVTKLARVAAAAVTNARAHQQVVAECAEALRRAPPPNRRGS